VQIYTTFDTAILLTDVGDTMIGAMTHLIASNPDFVGEVKNPLVRLDWITEPTLDDTTSFPWIINGNIQNCGDFEPASGAVPPLP
jgi:hypothetical protein